VAKKKARAPMPPRNVQAPQRRDSKTSTGSPLSQVPVWVWIVSAVCLVGAIAVIVVVTSSGSSSGTSVAQVTEAMAAAGCTYKQVAPYPPKHDPKGLNGGYHLDVPSLKTPTEGLWSTSPPSGGAHYPEWAVWGFYTSPVNPRMVVHNLEHGAVVIWWGPKVPQSQIDKLHAFYNQQTDGMFGTPYAALGNKIALTAWTAIPGGKGYYQDGNYGMGHIAVCPSFDQHAFATFRDAFRGKGPEGIPLQDDQEGMGP
jgi:hypothetical protein